MGGLRRGGLFTAISRDLPGFSFSWKRTVDQTSAGPLPRNMPRVPCSTNCRAPGADAISILVLSFLLLSARAAEPLPGTEVLRADDDLSEQMAAGGSRYFERETLLSPAGRASPCPTSNISRR